jgi:hypothetical protein
MYCGKAVHAIASVNLQYENLANSDFYASLFFSPFLS